ncbi:MAG TPA: hypothetical protein VMU87_18850 [Stellaceae bacterium]|nr:hypothetical protein [Stellaceae bacterium]
MSAARIRAAIRCAGRIATRLLLVGLVQCSAFEGPQPSPDAHSLCYNRLSTSAERLRALAATVCNGGTPRYLAQGLDLSACPLLVPMRVSFACSP